MLAEGDKAPLFELPSLEPLSEAVALVFFKVACPTCQFTLPYAQRIADATPQVIAISQDDAKATANFHERFQISMKTLLDKPPYPASTAFRLTHVPSIFLIEPDGVISMAVEGFSKMHLEKLASRFGVNVFRAGETVPALKPG